jgi:hypothetical protein
MINHLNARSYIFLYIPPGGGEKERQGGVLKLMGWDVGITAYGVEQRR